MYFWPSDVHFKTKPLSIFRKYVACITDAENFGMIGCIFAENGPLETGLESSLKGTVHSAKGDFKLGIMAAYSWRIDLQEVDLKRIF